MTRLDWLKTRHALLEREIAQLETERNRIRSYDHKSLLNMKKKEKLLVKTELTELLQHEPTI
jgi:uncharacterized protein YdcH (DUF465 family)